MHAERCEKTEREAVLYNQKRQLKAKREDSMKKNLKLMKKFVSQDETIIRLLQLVQIVLVLSQALLTAFRYNRKERKHVQIKQPKVIKQFNKHMGGIDLADNMVANYRIGIRGKKWWWPIFLTTLMSAS